MTKRTITFKDKEGVTHKITGTLQPNGDLVDDKGRVWRIIHSDNITGG